MNAHADMFIVVRHNELNAPRGIYRFLVSGVRKFPVFKSPKQALINAFYNMSANFWFATAKLLQFFELRKNNTNKNYHFQKYRSLYLCMSENFSNFAAY